MSTVGKAVSLLELLGGGPAEASLSDLAGRAGFDKTTARRLLIALIKTGLVDQDQQSRLYRLGAGIARLALMRETQFPLVRAAMPAIEALAGETGETVHLSEYSSRGLVSLRAVESTKANRVIVQPGEVLPMHATASGVAFLAFAETAVRERTLAGPLPGYTRHTVTDRTALARLVDEARARGYSIGAQGYEEDVFSVAAAVLAADGFAIGALAIAAPRVRIGEGDIERYGAAVGEAARSVGVCLAALRI